MTGGVSVVLSKLAATYLDTYNVSSIPCSDAVKIIMQEIRVK